ncbi:sodium-dependent bicarbonate transport family permease [Kiloniella laminariae]|uniref:Sodium-dependent bicarbonate transport family permease n=1 Tax=Kiloniella laminariae TaxID=454162 RepID=A0ABT4LQF9_9PROT|nr:sodium-dependent bicarbonate transport family permease [Kiloniella laminariae]MCZ4282556.1 sodium-dependent bicarbonate transport family permease [Kiloniella laminariae]
MDPIILFFLLGLIAALLRSELRLPPAIYEFLSVLLLLTIGLKGGVELATQPMSTLLPQMVAVIVMGFVLPLLSFPLLLKLGRFKRADAASLAAHYGSVSVGTFAVAVAYLGHQQIEYESHMPLFVVLLEVPAIIVGIILAKGITRETNWKALAHETFLGKSIVLLLGGLLIGWAVGPSGVEPLSGLFFNTFKGVLALFLLEMGLITAQHVSSLRKYGIPLILFGLGLPLASACIGALLGNLLGLSVGGTTVLATLAASASYIAVPAAIRTAVPEANPALSLAASLGITFPFNVLVGIPLYHRLALQISGTPL